MQSYGLTIDKFLDHAAKWAGDREVVSAHPDGALERIGYAALHVRANAMSGALLSLGLRAGDRIATLAWNSQHHLEIYYAAMGAGLVCHTLNPRLTVAHLAAMINEAEDRLLAVAANLLPLAEQLVAECPCIERVLVLDGQTPDRHPREGGDPSPAAEARGTGGEMGPRLRGGDEIGERGATLLHYETLLADRGAPVPWGDFDENTPAGLCYTSGTTGMPKGVLYTHRSNYLHTLRALQADAFAITARDCVLVAVPMFHANGWGLPFSCPAAGAKMVLPGRNADGASLVRLLRDEDVTVAVGVQTVWIGVLDELDRTGGELPALKRVLIGGSKCPEALIRRMQERLGAHVQTSWGMTELSPTGTIAPPDLPAPTSGHSGRPPMGLDLKLVDAAGVTLPAQRGVVGHLRVKGPAVVDRYFKADEDAVDAEGWFDTGDLAIIDAEGNLTISGRAKDLIKSGGEWINPSEIEAIVGRHPAVGAAAVIGRPDAKWGERPVLIVEPRKGAQLDAQALLAELRGKVADWWLPDQIAQVARMPLAATGKIDKNQLRADYASGRIEGERVRR
jgi:fatty-acyl-CoA synthase